MHILFLSDNFPPERNAAATRVYERACYWVKWGHKVTIVTSAPNFPEGKLFDGYKNKWYQVETMDGIKVVRVKTFIHSNTGVALRILDFLSYMVMAFVAGLFQKKIDVVVATSPQFFAAIGGWILSVVKRKPFVFELGDLWPASVVAVGAMKKSRMLCFLERIELFLYKRAAVIVALTKAFKKDLVERGIPQEKVEVIINGVDLNRYKPSKKDLILCKDYDLDNYFVAGYIGTHGMAQGLTNILDSAELLHDKKDIRFVFVGAGAERQHLIDIASQRRLDNVIFIPSQEKNAIAKFWSLCDMVLVHLRNNPVFKTVIPSKIFEAMAMGLPILLVAPQGEAKEIIDYEKAGVWVPAGNPKILSDTIMKLYSAPQKLRNYANNALIAASKYSREFQANKMLKVLEDVISK